MFANNNMEEIPERKKPAGRTKGSTTWKKYRWDLTMYDKETKQIIQGKFCSVKHINESLKLNLSPELVNRISTLNKVDKDRKLKEHSFLDKWGHIKIIKIDEAIVPPTTRKSKRPDNISPGQ